MNRKNLLILTGILAVVLAAVLLMNTRETPPGPSGHTMPTRTEQPTEPETTASAAPEQTLPEETRPEQTEPGDTGPAATEPQETQPQQTKPAATEPEAGDREVFPVELEGGALTVGGLFQFTGMNPDANDEFGEDIAGIELTNTSDRHMTAAEVTVLLDDGSLLSFRAEDIPAGRTVMAFCLEHETLSDPRSCLSVEGYAEFDSGDPLMTDLVAVTVDGIAITVTNLSDAELNDLNVICHGLLDSSCFGGATYQYPVSTLPAGASTVIHAEECFLGLVEVVRVEIGS